MSKSYHVGGMTCGGCAASVTKALQALDPQAQIEVDLDARQVTVDGSADEQAIAEAIEAAGFDFSGAVG